MNAYYQTDMYIVFFCIGVMFTGVSILTISLFVQAKENKLKREQLLKAWLNFGEFFTLRDGGISLMMENGYVAQEFAEEVKTLCSNDPTQDKGPKVQFDFSGTSEVKNLVKFTRIYHDWLPKFHKGMEHE